MIISDDRCGPVPTVPHSNSHDSNASVGNTVSIVCDHGYMFADGSLRHNVTCSTGYIWQGTLHHCESMQLSVCLILLYFAYFDKILKILFKTHIIIIIQFSTLIKARYFPNLVTVSCIL